MSDEQRHLEHEQVQVAAAAQPKNAWGDPISDERQRELREMLAAWDAPGADHGERKGPFDNVKLNGADVFWLVAHIGQEHLGTEDTAEDELRQVTDERLRALHTNQAIRQGFSTIDMSRLNLAGALLHDAHLEGASLAQAHLEC